MYGVQIPTVMLYDTDNPDPGRWRIRSYRGARKNHGGSLIGIELRLPWCASLFLISRQNDEIRPD